MKLLIEKVKDNPANLMRRAGYVFQRREGEEMSFVRPLARAGFPRFHAFAKLEGINLWINIHLDQKKETYGTATRHHGEYENSPALREEMLRIKKATQGN